MIPTTPRGTRTWLISRPFGRRQARTVSPTGSGSSATSRTPAAIPWIRSRVSARRSKRAALTPFCRAFSRSFPLAAMISSAFASSSAAIARSAASFRSVASRARRLAAALASLALRRTSLSGSCAGGAPAGARSIGCVLMSDPSRRRGSICSGRSLLFSDREDEVVPVDHLVEVLVAQDLVNLLRAAALDPGELLRSVVDQTAGQLPAVLIEDLHHVAFLKLPGDAHDPRGQEALAPLHQRLARAGVHPDLPLSRQVKRDPALAARHLLRPGHKERPGGSPFENGADDAGPGAVGDDCSRTAR